jgi:hypothetical protein
LPERSGGERLLAAAPDKRAEIMTKPEKPVEFDPGEVRFDLSIQDAFALTSVRSLSEFMRLLERLPEIRGQSYLFVNILGQRARLIMTVITAEEQEITATYELDPRPLGIDPQELFSAGAGSGNYPLPAHLEERIKRG